ncbi:MAG TPA: hemerythrin domain-containing protein [Longimicrobiales bacterium]|nr:hemerythrin domain-containing protein [Longimicrobiales bacterium]
MRRDTATAILREQHRLILRVVDAFEGAVADPPALADTVRMEGFIRFFRLFTDSCHHGSEEDVLFTTMEEHGIAAAGGPLEAMREEHRYGRSLVRVMADAIPALGNGHAEARATFAANAATYIGFIRAHIAREDDGIFELADNHIEGPACSRLCDAYEDVCQRRFEGMSISALERLASDLIVARTAPSPAPNA